VIPKILNVIISLFLKDTQIKSSPSGNIFSHLKCALLQFKTNPKLRTLTFKTMIEYALGESSYLFRGAFFNTVWPIWAIGITNMFSNLGAAASFFFSGKLINRFGFKLSLYADIIYCRLVNFTALLFPSIVSPALMSMTSLTYGLCTVSVSTLLQNEFTSGERATLGSLNSLFGSILFGIIAVLLGFLADRTNPRIALLIINIFQIIPLWFTYRIFRKS
jgi:MFS family permease